MSYTLSNELFNYDIFPKVFEAGKEATITIKPLGAHAVFPREGVQLQVCPLSQGTPWDYPHVHGWSERIDVTPDADGCIRFAYTFEGEQEHFIRFFNDDSDNRFLQLSVYSVEGGLVGRYPYAGDLHMHTFRSDGKQAPAVVAAAYRKIGYDFLAITDHRRYYPSLEAMNAYKDVPIEMNLVPGEEVHLPKGDADHINDIHIVNFGAEYSINGMFDSSENYKDVGEDKSKRSLYGNCPEMMTKEQYWDAVDEYAETIDIPDGVEKFAFAASQWTFEQIKKAGGLAVFAHPYWISNVTQVPDKLTDALFENMLFDAFEVLGGENYFEHNGWQTVKYYEQAAKGNKANIVGSTDSHSCINNRNAAICSTIVFSPENERKQLIQSVRDGMSVAVDTISTEYRIVGELRLVKYATFLYKNYFPLHDELCIEEGRAMKDYVCGEQGAREILECISGRVEKQRKKYFSF